MVFVEWFATRLHSRDYLTSELVSVCTGSFPGSVRSSWRSWLCSAQSTHMQAIVAGWCKHCFNSRLFSAQGFLCSYQSERVKQSICIYFQALIALWTISVLKLDLYSEISIVCALFVTWKIVQTIALGAQSLKFPPFSKEQTVNLTGSNAGTHFSFNKGSTMQQNEPVFCCSVSASRSSVH